MNIGRLEAFSDGVIAVAITLLVLDITVPDPARTTHLAHALAQRWPIYAAYVTSFLTIGIIWINHHVMIGRLRGADHTIAGLNLLLLMSIAVLPFTTDLMASYLRRSSGQHLAAGIYSGSFLLMAVLFATLNRHILLARTDLLRTEIPARERRRILARAVSGLGPYALATGLAVLSPYATLIICGAIAAFYALPVASGLARSG